MSEATDKGIRLSKVAREFNLGLHTVVEFLDKNGHKVESNPNTKIAGDLYDLLLQQFGTDKEIKAKSQQVVQQRQERETISLVVPPTPKEEPPAPKEVPVAAAPQAIPMASSSLSALTHAPPTTGRRLAMCSSTSVNGVIG